MKKYMGEEEVMKVNAALADKRYTVADIEAKPETIRVELIDGVIYYQATPTYNHQKLLLFLNIEIGSYIRSHNGKCEVIQAPLALYLNQDSETYLEPDLMVVCDENKIHKKGIVGGPDIVMEVVSPSSKIKDYILKQNKYQKSGVREYWILDLKQELITIHRFETGMVELHGFQDKIAVSIFDDLEIDFSMFHMIPDTD